MAKIRVNLTLSFSNCFLASVCVSPVLLFHNFFVTFYLDPLENLLNVSFDVSGTQVQLPFSANESVFANLDCLDTNMALQPMEMFSYTSSDFISKVLSIVVGQQGIEIEVSNLTKPLEVSLVTLLHLTKLINIRLCYPLTHQQHLAKPIAHITVLV